MVASMIQTQQASSAASSATEQVAANNAKLLDYRRGETSRRGQIRQQQLFQANADRTAGARVALAGSGLDGGAGSSNDVLADISEAGAMDAMILQADIEGELYSNQVQQQSVLTQGALDSAAIDNQATGSLLTQGAQTANYAYNSKAK